MSSIKVTPSALSGRVCIPPSKSAVHRALICAALAKGVSRISPVDFSNDINATIECIKALGAEVNKEGNTIYIDGTETFSVKKCNMPCCESGSTLRFFIPIACAGGVNAVFTGEGRLPQRPIGVYLDTLPRLGTELKTEGGLPLETSGKLCGGVIELPGNISSQFITGFLFALPLLNEDSEIILTSPLESKGYIDMTINTMAQFGVAVDKTCGGYKIKGNQSYKPRNISPEGDWSQAAFFMAAGAINGEVTVSGLDFLSAQGDRECVEIFSRFGADVKKAPDSLTVKKSKLKGITIDARQIPDLVPILAVTAAFASGTTVIKNAERLRIKESDRLKAICDGLSKIGADITETQDGLIINGKEKLYGGNAPGYNDHRIVMSFSVAALGCEKPVTITDKESINKSYPGFFEDYCLLGGKAENI